jgi:hypothetical protein
VVAKKRIARVRKRADEQDQHETPRENPLAEALPQRHRHAERRNGRVGKHQMRMMGDLLGSGLCGVERMRIGVVGW